jgi:hypothetical protein
MGRKSSSLLIPPASDVTAAVQWIASSDGLLVSVRVTIRLATAPSGGMRGVYVLSRLRSLDVVYLHELLLPRRTSPSDLFH